MKILFAFAFVALATAVPMSEIPQSVHLPEPEVPEFVMEAAPGFMPISIEPLFIAPEIAMEFYKSFEVNPPLGDAPELAYDLPVEAAEEIQPEPVNFVDSIPADETPGEAVNFVDVAENAEVEPFNYANSEPVADEILPEPIEVVEMPEARAPLNFIDSVAAEEIIPEPINFVDSIPADNIPGEAVNFVDVAENAEVEPFNYANSEPVAEEILPEPINIAHEINFDEDMASMMR